MFSGDLTSGYLMVIYRDVYDTYYAYRNEFDNLSDLNISNTGYEVPVSLVTRRDDVQMYSFLKKGLASIKNQDIHEALIVNGYANPEMNVRQFLQKHVILVILVLAVVIALILLLFIYYVISRRKERRLSESNNELNEKAYIDLATGLPNKNKCEEMMSSHLKISKPTACFMLDLNDLKKVNDTLGHEMGDIMILDKTRGTVFGGPNIVPSGFSLWMYYSSAESSSISSSFCSRFLYALEEIVNAIKHKIPTDKNMITPVAIEPASLW